MTWQAITAGSSAPAELLLTWLAQSSVLLAIGLIVGRASRRWGPAVQSAIYRTALGAVLLCPIGSFAMAAMGFGGLMLRLPELASIDQSPPTVVAPTTPITPAPFASTAPIPIVPQPAVSIGTPPNPAGPRILTASPPNLAPIPAAVEIERPRTTPPIAAFAIGLAARLGLAIAGLWVLVAAAFLIRLAVGQSRMARLRLGAVPADYEAESLCKALANQMRLNPPSVLRTPFLSSPCLDGLRRPAILLPEEAEANLRETFIHELAHLSRRDGLWNLLRRLASALFWFQPLLWVLSRRIEESAEEVCDDFVVAFGSDRSRYAGHLLELAGRTLPPLAPAGVGMISLPSMLGRRIRRILDSSRQLSTRAGRRAIAATLIAGLAGTILAGLVGVGTAARAVQGDPKDKEKAAADHPKVVKGQVVDPDGKPLSEASAHGLHPLGNDGHDSGLDEKSRVEVTGLDPKISRTVVFQHHGRNLGATLVIKPGESVDGVRTVTLRPCGTVTGRLVDGEGKPVVASVELGVNHGDNNGHGSITPGYKVAEDGRFRLTELIPGATHNVRAADPVRPGTRMGRERFQAFAMAERLVAEPGQVVDLGTFNVETGQRVKEPEQPARKTEDRPAESFREMPITGRILDLEGRPIAGVKVRVSGITKSKSGDLSPWLEAVRRGEPPWVAYKHVEEEKDEAKVPKGFVETDRDGRFRLPGIPAECHVGLTIEGPTIAYTSLEVVTRQMEPFKANGFSNTHGPGVQTIYGADFTYTASPGRVIQGVVVDAKTKKPMGDVGVWSYSFAGSTFIGIKSLKTTTDSAGHFKIEGMPKGHGNKLFIVPNDEQPYFMQEFRVPDPAGLGPVAVEITLHRGIFIEGKVTEKGTGKPVPKAFMHYFPFLDNPFAQQTPEFTRGGYTHGAGHQDRYTTRADGSYRLVGLPGHALVGAVNYSEKPYRSGAGSESIKGMDRNGTFPTWYNPVPPGRYFPTSMKEITPNAKAESVHLDLEMDPGMKVGLRVVDPQGKPVTGISAIGRLKRGRQESKPIDQSEFEVDGLGPEEERTVLLRHEERKLGLVIRVKPGDDRNGRIVVKLEPAATITGRVVDADGQPYPGATLRADPLPAGDYRPSLPQIGAGKNGRFAVTNVPVGCQYGLGAEGRAANMDRKFAWKKDITVRAGETTDIGDLKFDRN